MGKVKIAQVNTGTKGQAFDSSLAQFTDRRRLGRQC
jgi:hypothetical protein